MTVDVTWDGVALAKSATVREQDGGWFVELEQPMPVGTSVVLTGDVQATAQVARVHEGLGAGMLLKAAGSQQPAAGSSGSEPENSSEKKEKRKKKR
ncbi:MAG: hypothetical protein ACXVCV_12240 [Polyangia bacterium]